MNQISLYSTAFRNTPIDISHGEYYKLPQNYTPSSSKHPLPSRKDYLNYTLPIRSGQLLDSIYKKQQTYRRIARNKWTKRIPARYSRPAALIPYKHRHVFHKTSTRDPYINQWKSYLSSTTPQKNHQIIYRERTRDPYIKHSTFENVMNEPIRRLFDKPLIASPEDAMSSECRECDERGMDCMLVKTVLYYY